MNILIMFLLGLVAAVIDVTPMLIQKLDRSACVSAALHWIVLGFVIPSVEWSMLPWLKGVVLSLMLLLPVATLVFAQDKKAIIPMTVFSILLGAGVGAAGEALLQ